VKKYVEKNVLETVAAQGFTAEETGEKSLLSAVVPETSNSATSLPSGERSSEGGMVTTRVLLMDGDRAGLLAWIETPSVKQVFLVLKESLHILFTPEVRDLLDEVQTTPGKAPRNFLTFRDPGISEERLVFVRVRERLFEFHIAPLKEDAIYKLVEALSE
jgi:hypothetical protein